MNNTLAHRQLRNLVADQLRTAILEGRYRPGEWLRQERLAQELNVSQMPVREALKELSAEGLVEHVPYRGARVLAFSSEDVEDLYAHRAFLESRAAAHAARRITNSELEELQALLEQMDALTAPEQVNQYRSLNRQFHRVIFTASRREYLMRTLQQMWAAFPTMLIGNFSLTARQPLPFRDPTDSLEHHAILDALRRHDPEAAAQAMQTHILSAAQQLLASIQQNQEAEKTT
jgi:DNA-binding GntR family transcriptional regulator